MAHAANDGRAARGRDAILEVEDASVTFDMSRGVSRVLDDVTMDVERGEILGVVGESGSGKSMFASALMDAVVEPGQLTGEVRFNPEGGESVDVLDLSDEELRRLRWEKISMVFQGAMSSFDPTMRVGAQFRETLQAHDEDEEEGMERARRLLSDLYLDPERVLGSFPHELSGGMQQRALIALSLLLEPDVLVMDEPTAALDLLMQRSIVALLDRLKESYDLTMVFISHDLELVSELADRIAVMYAFEMVEIAEANEIITASNHPYTRSLINATPNLDTPVESMRPIEGESPDPVDVPEGCSYHPRCPMADDQCRSVDPDLLDAGDDHRSACHYWDDVADTIPLSLQEYRAGDEPETGETASTSVSVDRSRTDPVVSLRDVEVHFEEEQGFIEGIREDPGVVSAVDGVSLDIYENDVVALVGESGCGKTTLGKVAIGAEEATGGSVRYRGQDIWEAKAGDDVDVPWEEIRRALQIIHQDPGSALTPHKTVQSTLERPLKIWEPDLSAQDREARIYGMLERVGMTPPDDYANRYPHQLSGGEQQRVALVRALLMNPDLILADEAVSALDVSLRVDMMDLLLDLQEQFDTSYLFISHNLSNARYLTKKTDGRIGIMYLGELVEIGPADEVLDDPKHPYTKVLRWATANLDPEESNVEEPPLREIDVPDPLDPPSGCRFHTRCPEAREACAEESPSLEGAGDESRVACFRVLDDHPYWDSEPLSDEEFTALDDGARPSESSSD
ncbi:MAG: dipeptide ABC transporter ATP-binding protein [Halosimplex sp.]